MKVNEEPPAEILSFETQEQMDHIRAADSKAVQSDTLSLLGQHSLRWDWTAGARIDLPMYNFRSKRSRLSTFAQNQCLVIWVYNETPSSGHLILELKQDGNFSLSRPFYLNYTGWRTAHIPLSQMEGDAPQTGDFVEVQQLRITVPADHPESAGRFFIDDVYTTMLDARVPAPDEQAPYVRRLPPGSTYATIDKDRKAFPTREDLQIKEIPVSAEERAALQQLDATVRQGLLRARQGKGLSAKTFDAAIARFAKLGIREITVEDRTYLQAPYIALFGEGLPDNLLKEGFESGRIVRLRDFQSVLYALAIAYHTSSDADQRDRLREPFLLATRAYLQSGWAIGSNMGGIHHLGYNNRQIAPSFFMMKDELAEAGLLPAVSDSLMWYTGSHVVNSDTHANPNLDLYNTELPAWLLTALMHPDAAESARHIKRLAAWLSRTFAESSTKKGFRPDGTAWHHWGHYPAYTRGAIDRAVEISNTLTQAGFPLTAEGHAALQKAVRTILLYQQGDRIPRSLAGRHPLLGTHRPFAHSAAVREFVNLAPVDPELQALHAYHTTDAGEISGNWSLPYSAMSLHRRGNWLAAVRGFSVTTWGAEVYNCNRFGRYQSYGTLDINYRDDEEFPYLGYDWNLNPGTTITYLPLEELEATVPVWMVVGATRFANGVHDAEQRNGAHGFDLDDTMLLNLDPGYEEFFTKEALRARKSTFFMDDMILCLGSDITGEHPEAPVYTVLTQKGIAAGADGITVNGEALAYPSERTLDGVVTMFDGGRTGYVILDTGAPLVVRAGEQVSRGDEMTFDENRQPEPTPADAAITNKNRRRLLETRGTFLSAWIDHGVQPHRGRYLYWILPDVDRDTFEQKAAKLREFPELFYKVISAKPQLHAVRDVRSGTDTYICYEAQNLIPHAALHAVSEPCLLMITSEGKGFRVSAALPDLHQPAFSREHEAHKRYHSLPWDLVLTFEGDWTLQDGHDASVTARQVDGQTIVTIRAQHGFSSHFYLTSSVAAEDGEDAEDGEE